MSKEYIIPAKARSYLCVELYKIIKNENLETRPHFTKDTKLLKSVWVVSLPSANNELQQLLRKCKNFSLGFLFPILGLSKSAHYDWKLYINPSFPVNYTSKFRRGKKWKEKIKGPRFPAQHVAFGVDLRSEKNISPRSSNCPRNTFPEIPAEGS